MKLIITEKPSQVRDIAAAMGWTKCPEGARGPGVVCTPALGHLLEFAEPNEVLPGATWSDPATLLPLPTTIPMKPTKAGREFITRIKTLAKSATTVVVATDPDREGEGIGREILDFIGWTGPVQRLWLIGGMDPASIKKAMSKLRDGAETVGFYRAQQARATADWQYTLITRAMTAAGRHGCFGANLGTGGGRESVVSVGRVQTPTLALIVRRDELIENFVPTDHFKPWIDIGQGDQAARLSYDPTVRKDLLGQRVEGVTWVESDKPDEPPRPLFTDAKALQAFIDRAGEFEQVDVEAKASKMSKAPPKPFSLGTLQQEMNRAHKMTASKTLEAAQALYQAGHLSYPRTEREAYPKDLYTADAPDVIHALTGVSSIASAAGTVKFGGDLPGCYTTKPMEHFALMPTRKVPNLSSLPEQQRNVWLAVARRYIENHLPPATGTKVTLEVRLPVIGLIEDTPAVFKASGSRIENLGWMAAFRGAPADNMPVIKSGKASLDDLGAEAAKTKPPARYTEASLLADMKACGKYVADKDLANTLKEVTGIGTPATRDTIIETLLARQYISREKGGQLISRPSGRDLIAQAPAGLAQVEMTARWEQQLADLEDQSDATAIAGRDAFVLGQTKNAEQIITSCIEKMKRTAARPADASRAGGSNNPPTPKMLGLAKKIAEEKGIKLPKGATKSFDVVKEFLNANAGKPGGSGAGRSNPPTDKMLSFAKTVAARKNIALPAEIQTSFDACKSFLNQHA